MGVGHSLKVVHVVLYNSGSCAQCAVYLCVCMCAIVWCALRPWMRSDVSGTMLDVTRSQLSVMTASLEQQAMLALAAITDPDDRYNSQPLPHTTFTFSFCRSLSISAAFLICMFHVVFFPLPPVSLCPALCACRFCPRMIPWHMVFG